MGSYGEFTLAFRGYSAAQCINIGEYGEPEDEARKYREEEEECRREILRQEPNLRRIYDHFVEGRHPYAARRSLLDRDRAETHRDDHLWGFRLLRSQRPGEDFGGTTLRLFLKEETPEALREKVLADLQLSQLSGGPLRPHFEEARTDPLPPKGPLDPMILEALDGFDGGAKAGWISHALGVGFAREEDLRELALRGRAAPRLAALLLTSAMDGLPVPPAAFDLLAGMPAEEAAWGPAGHVLRFLPDAQWGEGIDRIRGVLGDLERLDSRLREWWLPVLRP